MLSLPSLGVVFRTIEFRRGSLLDAKDAFKADIVICER